MAANPTYRRYPIEQEPADEESTHDAILRALMSLNVRLDGMLPTLRASSAASLILSISTLLLTFVLIAMVLLRL
jgi:hypothetical protein